MKKIQYYVAVSLDGFICGANGDVSGFIHNSDGVEKYQKDLESFGTVIMGKNTYEFAYKYGMKPGDLPYPHMEHYIFSNHLKFEKSFDKIQIKNVDINEIMKIKEVSLTDIYLCGGGTFAGWLLENELIDTLKLKINPLLLGKGIKLFGGSTKSHHLTIINSQTFDAGLMINTYKVNY